MNTPEAQFLKLLALRLHEYGAGAHRLEGAVKSVAERLGMKCEVFSTPTSAFLTFREPGSDDTVAAIDSHLMRLNPGTVNLGRLCRVDAIAEAAASGRISLQAGTEDLRQVSREPPAMPIAVQLLAGSIIGAAVTTLLGGSWMDIVLAAVLGLGTGLLSRFCQGLQALGSLEPIAAFGATAAAYLLAPLLGASQVPLIVIGALITLMPGLDLTVAITELSTRHLASGTARFAGAVVILVKLALGVVMATQLMQALGFSNPATVVQLPPAWLGWVLLLAAGLAFGVLFEARREDYPVVLLATVGAYLANYLIAPRLGADAGVFLAALLVAAGSNAYSLLARRPASLMRLPGIILLVPGSLGYRAVTLLFSHDMEQGLSAALAVLVVLASLVGGLLLGNTLIPPRRHL